MEVCEIATRSTPGRIKNNKIKIKVIGNIQSFFAIFLDLINCIDCCSSSIEARVLRRWVSGWSGSKVTPKRDLSVTRKEKSSLHIVSGLASLCLLRKAADRNTRISLAWLLRR